MDDYRLTDQHSIVASFLPNLQVSRDSARNDLEIDAAP